MKPTIPPRRALPAAALLGILAMGGCGVAPASETVAPPAANLNGSWTGSVAAEGGTAFGTLQIAQSESTLRLTMVLPDLSISAAGTGAVSGTSFRGDLAFTLECPGTITLTGVIHEGRELTGTFRSADCNVEHEGSFRFIVRDG